jgi:hypothetical protein
MLLRKEKAVAAGSCNPHVAYNGQTVGLRRPVSLRSRDDGKYPPGCLCHSVGLGQMKVLRLDLPRWQNKESLSSNRQDSCLSVKVLAIKDSSSYLNPCSSQQVLVANKCYNCRTLQSFKPPSIPTREILLALSEW